MTWAYGKQVFGTEAGAVEAAVWSKLDGLDADQIIRRRAEIIVWLQDIDRAIHRDNARAAAQKIRDDMQGDGYDPKN